MKELMNLSMALLLIMTFVACGGDKNKNALADDDDDVVGNPAKIAFVEDFYETYYSSKGDAESLENLVENVLTEHAVEVLDRLSGEGDWSHVFVPAALDTITDRSQVAIDVEPQDPDNDLLYNVKITSAAGEAHTVVVAVVGNDGEFMVDSISNQDYLSE